MDPVIGSALISVGANLLANMFGAGAQAEARKRELQMQGAQGVLSMTQNQAQEQMRQQQGAFSSLIEAYRSNLGA